MTHYIRLKFGFIFQKMPSGQLSISRNYVSTTTNTQWRSQVFTRPKRMITMATPSRKYEL